MVLRDGYTIPKPLPRRISRTASAESYAAPSFARALQGSIDGLDAFEDMELFFVARDCISFIARGQKMHVEGHMSSGIVEQLEIVVV